MWEVWISAGLNSVWFCISERPTTKRTAVALRDFIYEVDGYPTMLVRIS